MANAKATVDSILAALAAPFHPDAVRWRVPRNTVGEQVRSHKRLGRAFAYLDARAVTDRLNATLAGRWSSHQTPIIENGVVTGFLCALTIQFPDGSSSTRTDVGVIEDGTLPDIALKAGVSDALKRAAVQFGVGRYLYDLDQPQVEVDAAGRIIGPRPALPDWALPEELRGAPEPASGSFRTGSAGPEQRKVRQGSHRATQARSATHQLDGLVPPRHRLVRFIDGESV